MAQKIRDARGFAQQTLGTVDQIASQQTLREKKSLI